MNKREEKYYLLLFKKLFPSFPDGEIISSESPDFIVDSSDKKYGIEISRIFQNAKVFGIKPQALDSMCESITNLIMKKLSETDTPHLEVFIIFSLHKALIKKQREVLSQKITELILGNIPKTNSWISLKNDFENKNIFPWEVTSIRILNYPKLQRHFVNFPRTGWVQKDMISDLQNAIDKKNDKIKKTFKSCDENWLLIHSEHFSSASFYEPSQDSLSYKYNSVFDRLFFLDGQNQKLFELCKE